MADRSPDALLFRPDEMLDSFKASEVDRDVVAFVRSPDPRAIRTPEHHKMTPTLGVLQDCGHKVALVADGSHVGRQWKGVRSDPRITRGGSGRSASAGARRRHYPCRCAPGYAEAIGVDLALRPPLNSPPPPVGTGSELFAMMRLYVNEAEAGASEMLSAMEPEQA